MAFLRKICAGILWFMGYICGIIEDGNRIGNDSCRRGPGVRSDAELFNEAKRDCYCPGKYRDRDKLAKHRLDRYYALARRGTFGWTKIDNEVKLYGGEAGGAMGKIDKRRKLAKGDNP
jgi:hypothetical protein